MKNFIKNGGKKVIKLAGIGLALLGAGFGIKWGVRHFDKPKEEEEHRGYTTIHLNSEEEFVDE